MFMKHRVQEIAPDALRRYMADHAERDYVLIDVRQPQEYEQEHLPGAVLISVSELEGRLGTLNPEQDHIFYCRSGARSMAAAMLAEDSRLLRGQVFSLQGGILAWGGGALADYPRVDVFSGIDSIRGMLLKALELEKAAHELYRQVRAAVKRDVMCDLMDTLIGVEIAHARVVYSYLEKYWNDGSQPIPPFGTMFDALQGKVLEGGLTVDELQPWIRGAAHGDCLELADLALEVEMNAYDLYRTLAYNAAQGNVPGFALGKDAEPVFLDLATQEKHHARLIMNRIRAFEETEA